MDDFAQVPAHRLAALMRLNQCPLGIWREQELGDVLRHQLDAPLIFNQEEAGTRCDAGGCAVDRNELYTVGKLLAHPDPPLGLLVTLKEYAKASDRVRAGIHDLGAGGPEAMGPLPRPVATVLYYAAIIAARMRCGRRITQLDDQILTRAASWAAKQLWVPPSLATFFHIASLGLGWPVA